MNKKLLLFLLLPAAAVLVGVVSESPRQAEPSVMPREVSHAQQDAEKPQAENAPALPAAPAGRTPEQIVSMPELPASQDVLWQKPSALEPMAAFQKWTAQPAAERDAAEGVRLAQARREAMRELIQKDPEQALVNAVPEVVRRALPAEVQSLLEQKVDGRGDLMVTATDTGPRAVRNRVTLDDGRSYEAYLYGNRAWKPSREDIPLHGIALDGKMALGQWPGRVLEPMEIAEVKDATGVEPVCPVSKEPIASGEETAVLAGATVNFYCGKTHARSQLHAAAAAEAIRPPGLGVRRQQEVAAASDGTGTLYPTILPEGDPAWTNGTKRVLIVPVEFVLRENAAGQEYVSYNQIDIWDMDEVVEDVSARFMEWSDGRYGFQPFGGDGSDVSPVIQVGGKAEEYNSENMEALRDGVLNGLELQDYVPEDYDLIVIFTGPAPFRDAESDSGLAEWGGLAWIGGQVSIMRNGDVGTLTHEVGHNLGLYHSSNMWTTPQVVDGATAYGEEYGDRYDQMGRGSSEFNVRYKQYLNWLDNEHLPLGHGDGVYTIREHDLGETSGVRGLEVVVDNNYAPFTSHDLFISYRLEGTDPVAGAPSYRAWSRMLRAYGAQVHLGSPGLAKTWLLDSTPETPNWEPPHPVSGDPQTYGNFDSPLLPGRTISYTRDTGGTVYVTNLSADPVAGELRVEVQHGPVAGNDPPSGSIQASTPQGTPGQNVVFTAFVTDPEDTDLAYHWQIPGFDDPANYSPAVFPNSRTLTVQFPTTGTWAIRCIVSDKHGGTVTLARTLSVVVNQAPAITAIGDRVTNEDTPISNVPFTISDPNTLISALTVSAISSDTYLFPAGSLVLGGSGANRTLTLTPGANRHGSATISIQVSDGLLVAVEEFQVFVQPVSPGTTYIAQGTAGWRYWASSLPPVGAWKTTAYNDTSWGLDNSRFVYPAAVFPFTFWTSLPAVPGRTTCYFRRSFTMPALPNGAPMLKLLCDDGAVVYVNGVEAWRQNMPAGTINHTTPAASSVEGTNENAWTTIPLSGSLFINGGTNVIAVEVHDYPGRGGSDVDFDLEFGLHLAPVVPAINNQSFPEDTIAVPINFSASDFESPGGLLTITATSSNRALVPDADVTVGLNIFTGQRYLRCKPQPNATGTTQITLKVSDGAAVTWRTFNLTFTPVNDAPWLQSLPDMTVAFGETPPLIPVRVGDVDSAVGALNVTATSSGVLSLTAINVLPGPAPDMRWLQIIPNPGMAAQANVTVSVSDGAASTPDTFVFRVGFPLSTGAPASDVIVAPGDSWAYWDQSAYPGDAWRLPSFPDTDWKRGLGRLGYGIGGESTVVNANNAAGSQRNPSVLFRKTFDIANPADYSVLHLFLQRDDGIAVHLNGTQIYAENLPADHTLGSLALSEVTGTQQTLWRQYTIDASRLVAGRNLLAVEVHQASLTGTDLNFDLQLSGDLAGQPELFMRPVGEDMELSWSAAHQGWTAHTSTDLANWTAVTGTPVLENGWFYVIHPSVLPREFFKLVKP